MAAAHGRLDPATEGAPPIPAPVVEELLDRMLARYGADRGERMVTALNDYLGEHPELVALLKTPGLTSRHGFPQLLDDLVEHVRRAQTI